MKEALEMAEVNVISVATSNILKKIVMRSFK